MGALLDFHLEPYQTEWEAYGKHELIQSTIEDICHAILAKKEHAQQGAEEAYDLLYELIEDTIEDYLPEADHADYA